MIIDQINTGSKSAYNDFIKRFVLFVLVKLFSHALVSSVDGHERALAEIKKDILRLKEGNDLNA